MIAKQFQDILLPQILTFISGLVPYLCVIAGALLSLLLIGLALFYNLRLLNDSGVLRNPVFGTLGAMIDNYKAERLERFSNSPIGRGYAAYKESMAYEADEAMQIESISLGPKEEFHADFGGYEPDYGNVEFTDLEDYKYDNS